MNTATLVKDIGVTKQPWGITNNQAVYRLSPPCQGVSLVFVSEASFTSQGIDLHETMAFPSDGYKPIAFVPLMEVRVASQAECLRELGYEIEGSN